MLTVVLFTITPAQFQPTINEDNSRIQIEMVPGTTLEQTEVVADKVAAIMYKQPEVERALMRIREGNGTIFVTLKKDREKTSIEFERDLADYAPGDSGCAGELCLAVRAAAATATATSRSC